MWGKRPNKITTSSTLYRPKWSADEELGDPEVFAVVVSADLDESSVASENAIIIADLRSEVDRQAMLSHNYSDIKS